VDNPKFFQYTDCPRCGRYFTIIIMDNLPLLAPYCRKCGSKSTYNTEENKNETTRLIQL
jgi:hypothetical protein